MRPRQRMPRPPAFVSTATRRPGGSGCVDSSAATSISSSSERARMTPAWWKSASTAASEPASAAVWELAARAPVAGRAALQREDRLPSGDPTGEPAEPARIAERLEVEEHDVRLVVVLPPLEQVVRGDVRLVPDRDERGEAEPARLRRLEQCQTRARRSGTRSRCFRAAPNAPRTSRSSRGLRRRCRGSSGRSVAPRGSERARAAAPAARPPRCRPRRSRPR